MTRGVVGNARSLSATAGHDAAERGPVSLAAVGAICPYLAADGGWRAARPVPGHRCTAAEPPEPLSTATQRSLCLRDSHIGCPAYATAIARRRTDLARAGIAPERLEQSRVAGTARSLPVALDRPARVAASSRVTRISRTTTAAALGIAAAAAVLAIVLARMPDTGAASSPPRASAVEGAIVAGAPTGTVLAATGTPAPSATARPATPTASPTVEDRLYVVEAGDTLSAIAERFGTTVAVLVELNDIDDPGRLQIGQELRLP